MNTFKFKQFEIHQEECAMKIGTDGVLLGAWTHVDGTPSVLDIGTGTGLLALMMAQKGAGEVVALEIEPQACQQARTNISHSLWCDRITVLCDDFKHFSTANPPRFDCIISNPPYFTQSRPSPSSTRTMARHDDLLPAEVLLKGVKRCLAEKGLFSCILPVEKQQNFIITALSFQLYLSKRCEVKTVSHKPCSRVLLEFSNSHVQQSENHILTLYDTDRNKTPEYDTLTRDFYLDFIP